MILNLIAMSISVLIYMIMHQGMREGIDIDENFHLTKHFSSKDNIGMSFIPRYHLFFFM